GNSGVILSQIFRGRSIGLANKDSVSSQELADAFSNGVTLAYEAVTNPVEGTILTVVIDSTEIAKESSSLIDVVDLMTSITNDVRKSLDETPELLPAVKAVGVGDAGGKRLLVSNDACLAALPLKTIQDFSDQEKN